MLVTCAYFDHTTFPVWVTNPNYDTLTSKTAPFVITPNDVYVLDCGFFFTDRIGNLKVVWSYGWVTFAYLNLNPIGLMNLSCFGGFLVKFSPTKHTLFILLFQHFLFLLPDLITSNISAYVIGLTFSTGTDHFPAFYFLFCFTMLVKTFEFLCCYLSIRYAGTAPSWISSTLLFAFFSSWALMVFFIWIFSLNRSRLKILALMPLNVLAFLEIILDFLASFFLRFYSASSLSPYRFLCNYM